MLASNRVECCPEPFQMQAATVKFLGSYHVDILVGEHGLYFRAHMDNNQIVPITNDHHGFSYLRESLSNQRKNGKSTC